MDIPMLDEMEFQRVEQLLREGMRASKEFRERHGLPLENLDILSRFKPALDEYNRITGFGETNPNALWHHRIAMYGPPCQRCGKVLRGPSASKCLQCGWPRRLESNSRT